MSITSLASFGQALRQFQILDAKQLEELPELEARIPDPRSLARELFQRGWLTAFQANQLFQGKGKELVLGQYVIVDRIGDGGMGRVFKARHRRLDRMDALKVIRKECLANAAAVQRFHQEARAAARVSHTNIVSIYDASEANGTHIFAMEFVDGIDLARLVQRDGPLPIPLACDYIRHSALGLQHAHERGLVANPVRVVAIAAPPGVQAVAGDQRRGGVKRFWRKPTACAIIATRH